MTLIFLLLLQKIIFNSVFFLLLQNAKEIFSFIWFWPNDLVKAPRKPSFISVIFFPNLIASSHPLRE